LRDTQLSKRSFQAGLWFGHNSTAKDNNSQDLRFDQKVADTEAVPDKIKKALSPFMPKNITQSEEGFKKFFIPGWTGEALVSKEVSQFNKVLDTVHIDCKKQFKNLKNLNRRTKIAIYNEFLSYAEYKTLNCTELDHYQQLWVEMKKENSQYKVHIENFIDIYCFRVSVIYLLKVRFICVLVNELNGSFDNKHFLYPTSSITNIFKKGSRTELQSSIIEPNVYSWYRPNQSLEYVHKQFFYCSQNLCVTDVIKNISIRSEKILNQKTFYSHSLSHKNFGFFLNSLLLNFPLWKNTLDDNLNINQFYSDDLEIISSKFVGDYLESMALSHWLAQDHNKDIKWDQILCPDFKKDDFENGEYLKLANEIQFLTFLAQIAKKQGYNPVDFLSQTTQGHKRNIEKSNSAQTSLLPSDQINEQSYDRIILNLTEFPKNNSQHFMINRIIEESNELKDNGLLFVISSKKLFIASQKNKIENLLNKLKVEAIITLEDIAGKGEVGSYIYILSNRKQVRLKATKENVNHFRFSGNLTTFAQFSTLTQLIQSFFINNLADVPPMYHKFINNFKLEFFQDAIVEGRLIHSSTKDSSKITHPLFFRNLLSSCLPLEAFFNIKQINFDKSQKEDHPIFEFSGHEDNPADHVLIIDQRHKEMTRLEIIPTSILELKSYEYGVANCSYFYIYPKVKDISLLAIHDFYQSSIGKQIIDLTFGSDTTKIKPNLTQLLIPKFYAESFELPEHIAKGLDFINFTEDQILNMHPSLIEENFNNIKYIIEDIAKKYPMAITHMLSNFKYSIERCLNKIGSLEDNQSINFNNPAIKAPLLLSKTLPIYPENPDVYVEFNNENSLQLIHNEFTHFKQRRNEVDGIINHYIEIYYNETVVLTLYSDKTLLSFISFILKNLQNVPMSAMLQGIKVPRVEDLQSIINSFHSMQRSITKVVDEVPLLINKIINHKISKF
jgi:hypothetical protein